MNKNTFNNNKIELEEKLITEVSAYSSLFNKRDKDYSNRAKKNMHWNDIAAVLDYPVAECKSKWKNLKDTFFHYVRMHKNTSSGSGAENKIKWVHFDSLQFLLPCLDNPSTMSNLSNESEALENTESERECAQKSRSKNDMDDVIIQTLTNLETEKMPSESKLFLESLIPRFERLSNENRSYIQFKILEMLHQIEFSYFENV